MTVLPRSGSEGREGVVCATRCCARESRARAYQGVGQTLRLFRWWAQGLRRRRALVTRRPPANHVLTMTLVVLALTLVITLRGLSVPLPDGCDARLDRYGIECYLPHSSLGREPGPACAEQLEALYLRCPRWRDAWIGRLIHTWRVEQEAEPNPPAGAD